MSPCTYHKEEILTIKKRVAVLVKRSVKRVRQMHGIPDGQVKFYEYLRLVFQTENHLFTYLFTYMHMYASYSSDSTLVCERSTLNTLLRKKIVATIFKILSD